MDASSPTALNISGRSCYAFPNPRGQVRFSYDADGDLVADVGIVSDDLDLGDGWHSLTMTLRPLIFEAIPENFDGLELELDINSDEWVGSFCLYEHGELWNNRVRFSTNPATGQLFVIWNADCADPIRYDEHAVPHRIQVRCPVDVYPPRKATAFERAMGLARTLEQRYIDGDGQARAALRVELVELLHTASRHSSLPKHYRRLLAALDG